MSSFFKPATYNGETKEQMWMSSIGDFHDSICSCCKPFAHLLRIIFPEGHRDEDKTIKQIIQRDLKCHFGGEEDESLGLATASAGVNQTTEEEREDYIKDEDLSELIDAAAAVAATER